MSDMGQSETCRVTHLTESFVLLFLAVGAEFDGPEGSDGGILSIALAIEEREEVLPGPKL